MENPWLNLSSNPPYVCEADRAAVHTFNGKYGQSSTAKLQLTSLPEPYVGNPITAKVIALMSNPGHSEDDESAHSNPKLRNCMLQNLRLEPSEESFYPLREDLKNTPVGRYWRTRLTPLIQEVGASSVIKNFAVIEFHGYHSVSFGGGGWLAAHPFPSQRFTMELLNSALRSSEKIFIILRKKTDWLKQIPELNSKALFHKNPRNATFSRANLGSPNFDAIAERLRPM